MVQSERIAFLSSGIAPVLQSKFRSCSLNISRSFSDSKVLYRKAIRANLRAVQPPTAPPNESVAAVTGTPVEKVTPVLTFQEAIQRLSTYWASKGCIIWHPYNVEVGAGTMNPATFLRVLGPEPWSIAYDEPSIRPDDSRYGENPNRLQRHTQFQVIIKPAPDCAQELVVGSYQALGIDTCRNDIRFVEDNWESPALGAWGLGWEIWLNGMEVTQFTYFQQAGGIILDSVSLEVTYGLERIIMALQEKTHFKDIIYAPGITYGDIFVQSEIEMSKYNLDDADIDRNKQMFQLYEAEAVALLEKRLPIPAYNYLLKASHTFNILDARGAIGVTERARYFQRMRALSRDVAHEWLNRREEIGFPLLAKQNDNLQTTTHQPKILDEVAKRSKTANFVLEIGLEELPAGDVNSVIEQVRILLTTVLNEARLAYASVEVNGTPRRVLVSVRELQTRQADETKRVRGPPLRVAMKDGELTKAGVGFMRSQGVPSDALDFDENEGYMYATVEEKGRSAEAVLADELPSGVLERISFGKSMRWNDTTVSFSRPIRWLLCLLDDQIIPFSYAGVLSSNTTRSLRGADGFAKAVTIPSASDCLRILRGLQIMVSRDDRSKLIREHAEQLAKSVGGVVPDEYLNGALLEEITDLVESPIPLSGSFDEQFLNLPREVLETVMKKHQRYLPVMQADSTLLTNSFITVANGDCAELDVDMVRKGNEAVLRARYSDAAFFYENDTNEKRLGDFVPQLSGLTFQEKLGSMLDKTKRVQYGIGKLGRLFGLADAEIADAEQVAKLFKADLATSMVIEMTSLAGTIGRHYAIKSGEVSEAVCDAILEANLPRFSGDQVAQTKAGAAVAIADRMDSLVGLFSVGLMPKSTADPYALRRAALGIVQTLVNVRFDVNISDLISIVAESIQVQTGDDIAIETQNNVLEFISKRLEGYLLDNIGFADDIVKGALAVERNCKNPLSAISVCNALRHLTETDKQSLMEAQEAYSRAARLLGAVKDITTEELLKTDIRECLFDCEQERLLFQALKDVETRDDDNLIIEDLILNKIKSLVNMKAIIDEFFDSVFVNSEDPKVRKNRLSLCARIVGMTSKLVDLSFLV